MLEELHGEYSGFRWHNSLMAYRLPIKSDADKNRKANFSVKVETTWMIDNINVWETFDLNRFNAHLTFYYHPKFLEDIGLFVQFYHGMDYYNIYFQHQLDVMRFGIMTNLLRLLDLKDEEKIKIQNSYFLMDFYIVSAPWLYNASNWCFAKLKLK